VAGEKKRVFSETRRTTTTRGLWQRDGVDRALRHFHSIAHSKTITLFFLSYKSSVSPDTFRFHKYSNQDMSCTLCYYYYYYYYVLSPLCKVFAILCPKQAMILGYLLLQLFCSYSVSYM